MKLLLAQPNELYFIWQVELLLYNLEVHDWPSHDIIILFSFNPSVGIEKYVKKLIDKFPKHNEDGKIIERGNHVELTNIRGAYYKLVENQLELGI